MSAPDASLLRRASPAYREAVARSAPSREQVRRAIRPASAIVEVAGYAVDPQQKTGAPWKDRRLKSTGVDLRLVLLNGETVYVSLSARTTRSLAADLLAALPRPPLLRQPVKRQK